MKRGGSGSRLRFHLRGRADVGASSQFDVESIPTMTQIHDFSLADLPMCRLRSQCERQLFSLRFATSRKKPLMMLVAPLKNLVFPVHLTIPRSLQLNV
jgi:hypothetical protein